MLKLITRLIRIVGTIPLRHGSMPARPHLDVGGAEQAEDRPRGADRLGVRREQQDAERAGEQRREVDRQEAHAPDSRLEHPPQHVEHVHVEADVDEVPVQEART